MLVAALCAALPCAAQTVALSKELVGIKSPMTDEQRARVAQYAVQIGERFASPESDPVAVVNARNEVIELCRSLQTSDIFRRELSLNLIKEFEPLTKSPETFRATNAFLVAQFLRTPEGVDFLVDNVDPDTQPDAGLRAAAAQQLPKAAPNAGLSPPQVDALAKKLAAAARTETNWRAVAAEIEAVGELLRMKLPPAQASAVADSQAAIINSLTERINKGGEGNKELISALQRGLLVVRDQLTNIGEPGRSKLLQGISPSLTQIQEMKTKKAAEFQDNPQQDAAFKNTVITAELLQGVARGQR